EHGVPMSDIATALARMAQGDAPLLLAPDPPYMTAPAAPHDKRGRSDNATRGPRDDSQRRTFPRSGDTPRDHRGNRVSDPRAERGPGAYREPRADRPFDARPAHAGQSHDAMRGDRGAQSARPPRKAPEA